MYQPELSVFSFPFHYIFLIYTKVTSSSNDAIFSFKPQIKKRKEFTKNKGRMKTKLLLLFFYIFYFTFG